MYQKWRMLVGMHTVSVEQMRSVVDVGQNCLSMMVGMYHRSSKNPA